MEYNGAVFTQFAATKTFIIKNTLYAVMIFYAGRMIDLEIQKAATTVREGKPYYQMFRYFPFAVMMTVVILPSLWVHAKNGPILIVMRFLIPVVLSTSVFSIVNELYGLEFGTNSDLALVIFLGLAVGLFLSYMELKILGHSKTLLFKAGKTAGNVADALEKYQQVHGEYPERLDSLVPNYLPELPATGFDQRSLCTGNKISSEETFSYQLLDPALNRGKQSYLLSILTDGQHYVYLPGVTQSGFIKVEHLKLETKIRATNHFTKMVKAEA
jgi:hypothetical protein